MSKRDKESLKDDELEDREEKIKYAMDYKTVLSRIRNGDFIFKEDNNNEIDFLREYDKKKINENFGNTVPPMVDHEEWTRHQEQKMQRIEAERRIEERRRQEIEELKKKSRFFLER